MGRRVKRASRVAVSACPSAADITEDRIDGSIRLVHKDTIYSNWGELQDNLQGNYNDGDDVDIIKVLGTKTVRNAELTLED